MEYDFYKEISKGKTLFRRGRNRNEKDIDNFYCPDWTVHNL